MQSSATRLSAIFALAGASAPAALAATGEKTLFSGFSDPVTHLVMLGVLVFFAIIWRLGAFKMVLGGLDNRAEAIRKELEEAVSLREQAAQALSAAERRQQESDNAAEDIVKAAKQEAKAILEDARKQLAERIARREAQAEARIARAEAEAADQVRRAASDAATEAARRILQADTGTDQFEAAAREIERALRS